MAETVRKQYKMTSLKRGFRVESKNAKKTQSLMQSKPADMSPLKHFFFLKKHQMCMDTCINIPDMCREGKQESPAGQERQTETGGSSSVRVGLFVVQDLSSTGGDGGAADDLQPPAGQGHTY